MMDNGIRIVRMALVFILTLSAKNIREIGWMDRNMVKERITIKMETNTLEIGLKIKKMAEESLNIPVALSTMENGSMIKHVIKVK